MAASVLMWVHACTGEQVTQVQVSSITVFPEEVEVVAGEEVQLTATVEDETGEPLPSAAPEWSSGAPSVATVDEAGNVRALAAGTAEIRATFGDAFGIAMVEVLPAPGIVLSAQEVSLSAPAGEEAPGPRTVQVTNAGTGALTGLEVEVSHEGGDAWLSAELAGSSTPTELTLAAEPGGLDAGVYRARLTISTETEGVGPREMEVTLALTGFTVTESGGNTEVTEQGGTDTLAVRLDVQPQTDVVLTVTSSDAGEAAAAPARLTFTPSSWSTPQSVVVTGVDDTEADGRQTSTVTVAVDPGSSEDRFDGVPARRVSVRTEDDDRAGLVVVESGGTTEVAEGASTDGFTVALSAQPLSDVVLVLTSDDAGEVSVTPAALRFTPLDWQSARTVQVTGVDDPAVDGDQVTSIVLAVDAAASDDAFDGVEDEVRVTTTDDDLPGWSLVESGGTTAVTEAGGTDTFTLALTAQPVGTVVVGVRSSDEGEATVGPASLSFTAADWSTPKTVTVTGANDALIDGSQSASVTVAVNDGASDDAWDDLADLTVAVSNADDDVAGFTVTQSGGTTLVTEAGGTDDLAVVLTAQPASDVVLRVSASDPTEATAEPATLTFAPESWDTPQTVTVRGVDDVTADGPQPSTVSVAVDPAASDDSWDAVAPSSVGVTTADDDPAGFTVTESGGSTMATEGGPGDELQIALTASPTSSVVLAISSANVLELSVTPSTLTFGPADWNVPQTVAVEAIDEIFPDGARTVTVTVAVVDLFSDDAFDAAPDRTVEVSTIDNDVTASLVISESDGVTVVYESGTRDTITVSLGSQPSPNVVLTVTGDTPTEATVAPASLTFMPAGWSTPQIVTVTGVDDGIPDADRTSTVRIAVDDAASDDAYDGVADAVVTVTTRVEAPTGVSGPNPTGHPDVSSAALVASYDMSTLTSDGRLQDFSGRGLHGIVSGTTEVVSPRGRAARFATAPRDRIELPPQPDFDLDGPLSIATWIRLDALGRHQHVVACDDKFVIWVTPEDRVRFTNALGDGAETAVALTTGQWYGIVGVYRGGAGDVVDTGNIEIWIDGQPAALVLLSGSGQLPPRWRDGTLWPSDACYIGFESHQGRPDHQTLAFHGSVDEVLIFGRALTPTEAQLLGSP